MFWNRIKESIKQPGSTKSIHQKPDPNKQDNKSLPLVFLKRLVPIGRLSDRDLTELKATISHYKPGFIIFKLNEISATLTYIVKGQCFLESSNGNGYEIEASTFKSYYPLSSDYHSHSTAIAKTAVTTIHFPLDLLQKSNRNSRNPLLNIEDIPEDTADWEISAGRAKRLK